MVHVQSCKTFLHYLLGKHFNPQEADCNICCQVPVFQTVFSSGVPQQSKGGLSACILRLPFHSTGQPHGVGEFWHMHLPRK